MRIHIRRSRGRGLLCPAGLALGAALSVLPAAIPAQAQTFDEIVEIVDELETSLRTALAAESTARAGDFARLEAGLHSARASAEPNTELMAALEQIQARLDRLAAAQALPGVASIPSPPAPLETPDPEAAVPGVDLAIHTDLVSRYVWRGLAFSDSPCLQPSLDFDWRGFTFGVWGSFSFSPAAGDTTGSTYSELDLSLSRSIETLAGELTGAVSTYYFPSEGASYFHWDNRDGAHVIEATLSLELPEPMPIQLLVARNIHNDPDRSTFFGASAPLLRGPTALSLSLGAAPGRSAWYGVDSYMAQMVEVGLHASRTLTLGRGVAPSLGVSYIVNPRLERPYLVASLGL